MKSLIEDINESNNIELVSDGNERGFDYVDLGLSSGTMWATCNVGATKPENQGLLFQFGRVDGYVYNDSNNQFRTKYQNKQDTGDEYIPVTSSGNIYDKGTTLDLTDDAAHVNMGGKWMMPTNDQLGELLNNTTHKVETINGVKGMLFTSDINGHQLFIPFAGYWHGRFYNEGSCSRVWSSQVHASYDYNAYRLYCYSKNDANVFNDNRSFAFSVRGVFKK